ncbi:substrate-binding domain-containing protein [Mesorhizobium sp. CAU 1732]|uniref:substrate-binding domain-containing protein n=1 Tax=Mesorhizobium sp. CAU 1732 TaxID=3140358 RepID=UPI003261A97F
MERRTFIKSSMATALLALAPALALRAANAADPLKVGILIPLSGPAGLFGASAQNSAKLAITEINAAGGILGRQIEPIFADVGGPPADAVQAAQRIWRSEGAEAFVGMHDSAVRGALVGVFRGQVPYVYTSVYEGGECATGTYVLAETPSQQLEPVIPWLAENEGATDWYLIGNDYNWPRETNAAAKAYIEASGGKVVGEEYLPFTADNFDSNLARIQSSGANAVLITLVGGASVTFNRAFASFGLADKAIRLGTLIEENTLMGIGEQNSARLFASGGYFSAIDTEPARAFADAYSAEFGANGAVLNLMGQSVYEGLLFLKAIAEKTGSLDVAAMDAAADGTSYEGPRGTATMTNRHVARDVYLAQAEGAGFRIIETFANVDPGQTCT